MRAELIKSGGDRHTFVVDQIDRQHLRQLVGVFLQERMQLRLILHGGSQPAALHFAQSAEQETVCLADRAIGVFIQGSRGTEGFKLGLLQRHLTVLDDRGQCKGNI